MRCKSSREISILVSVLGYALMESMAWNINTTNNNNNPKVNPSDWNPLISIVLLLTIVFPTLHPFQHVCFDSRNILTFYMVHFDTQNPLRFIWMKPKYLYSHYYFYMWCNQNSSPLRALYFRKLRYSLDDFDKIYEFSWIIYMNVKNKRIFVFRDNHNFGCCLFPIFNILFTFFNNILHKMIKISNFNYL